MRRSLISITGITCCSVLLSGCGAIVKPIVKAGFKALSKSGDEIVSGAAKGIGKNSDSFYTNPSKGYWKEFSDQSSLTSRPLRTLGRTTIGNDEEKDYQNEIAKLNQEIAVKPNHSLYHLRGELKAEHLNDYEGAISDYSK